MDIRDYNLYLHRNTHFTGKAAWMLDAPMDAYYRTVLPGHNAVAWVDSHMCDTSAPTLWTRTFARWAHG